MPLSLMEFAGRCLISWTRSKREADYLHQPALRSATRITARAPWISSMRSKGPAHRFADGLGICGVTLVRLDVRLHELRGHQLYRVPERFQLPRPVMRAAARFHADQAWRQVGEERHTCSRFSGFLSTALPRSSTPCTWITFFAKSIPTVVIFISVASPGWWKYHISTLALRCRFGKGRPSHYSELRQLYFGEKSLK